MQEAKFVNADVCAAPVRFLAPVIICVDLSENENIKEISMNRTIYLDNAATTQPFPEVLDAMLPYYGSSYGNPSSAYELGEESKRAVEEARSIIAGTLHDEPETIYFTSGGTESDNWALRYAADMARTGRTDEGDTDEEAGFGKAYECGAEGKARLSETPAYGMDKERGIHGKPVYGTDREQGIRETSEYGTDRERGIYGKCEYGTGVNRINECDTGKNTGGSRISVNGIGRERGTHGTYRYDLKREKSPHIITTSVEHHAILRTCEALEKEGLWVAYLPVNRDGIVDLSALEQLIGPSTVMMSVMFANNEIGTVQPIRQAAEIAHRHGALFHTDAVQAYGQIPIVPQQLGIDLLSASGHKLNGPKGVGFLYARKGLDIKPMVRGGMQEKGRRAGTENVPGIVGLGCAARISHQMMKQKINRETSLRNYFIRRLLTEIRDVKINGSMQMRLPNNINCCIRGVDGGALVALLDMEGICISAASACQTVSSEPSHVQLAIGNSPAQAQTAIRITLGPQTTRDELDITVDTLKRLVEKLRGMG